MSELSAGRASYNVLAGYATVVIGFFAPLSTRPKQKISLSVAQCIILYIYFFLQLMTYD